MVKTPPFKELTEEQAKLVQTDWDYIKTQANEILYNFFEKFPGNQKQFKAFIGKDLDDIKDTPEFADHAEKIATLFGQVIENLAKDSTKIKELINDMGLRHKDRGISKFAFLEFREAFMDFLRFNVGGSLDGMQVCQSLYLQLQSMIKNVFYLGLD
uniref:Globin n=1 Tax=Polypedilum vanderplanki TaxID=319348 RepID=S6BNG3_POLVA|nr:globin [Polypedilum vanderplanki]